MVNEVKSNLVRIGYVPVSDCAPLIVAKELGFFKQLDLDVVLSRERSWTILHDKILYGQLEAAHALSTFPMALTMGLKGIRMDAITGLVLSLQGNAITLGHHLWEQGVHSGTDLLNYLRRNSGNRQLRFGIVHEFSWQHILLRRWLESNGIRLDERIRFLEINPDEMFPHLHLGYLDGFCVGEPWTSLSVLAGAGFCVATSGELAPLHPEKVLLTSQRFSEEQHDVHLRLISAIRAACSWVDMPENRSAVCFLLARGEYLNAPLNCVRPALLGPFRFLPPAFKAFHQFNLAYHEPSLFFQFRANEPDANKGHAILEPLCRLSNRTLSGSDQRALVEKTFRLDLFDEAATLYPITTLQLPTNPYEKQNA